MNRPAMVRIDRQGQLIDAATYAQLESQRIQGQTDLYTMQALMAGKLAAIAQFFERRQDERGIRIAHRESVGGFEMVGEITIEIFGGDYHE